MTSAPVRIAGILLAAGASRRFGAANKLLSEIDGAPLIRRSAEALISTQALAPLVVVVRPGADDVRAALAGLPVLFAVNADADEGIASSIRTGLRSIEDDARAVLIAQADMPNLTARSIAALATAFVARAGNAIVAPRGPSGRIGTPIIWPASDRPHLAALTGDTGARPLVQARRDAIVTVDVSDDAAFADIDTPADLAAWRQTQGLADDD